MAIEWGGLSAKQERVGIDISMSPSSVSSSTTEVTLTVTYYVQSVFAISDNQVLTLSDTWGGAQYGFNISGTNVTVMVVQRTFTRALQYGTTQHVIFGGVISGHYNGDTPSHRRGWNIPARPATVPGGGALGLTSITSSKVRNTITNVLTNGSSIIEFQFQWATNTAFTANEDNYKHNGSVYDVTGLSPGTKYYFRARARNAVGWGPWSATKTATTLATEPSAPGTPTASDASADMVTLEWSAPSNDGGAGVTGYDVQWANNSSFSGATLSSQSTSRTRTLTGLSANTTYYVRVRAKNSAGTGPWSGVRSFTTSSNGYVKIDDQWVEVSSIYVKVQTAFGPLWRPAAAYKKVSGNWTT